jgi:hypothetical protein
MTSARFVVLPVKAEPERVVFWFFFSPSPSSSSSAPTVRLPSTATQCVNGPLGAMPFLIKRARVKQWTPAMQLRMCLSRPRRNATLATTDPVSSCCCNRNARRSCRRNRSVRLCRGCVCYRSLLDFSAALPVQRAVVLVSQHFGPRSLLHAAALKGLCLVQTGLKAFPAARRAIVEALAIMEELGHQQDEDYGSLRALGGLDREQKRYKEVLAIYSKAKAVLVPHKEGNAYRALLNDMAICHVELQQERGRCMVQGSLVQGSY